MTTKRCRTFATGGKPALESSILHFLEVTIIHNTNQLPFRWSKVIHPSPRTAPKFIIWLSGLVILCDLLQRAIWGHDKIGATAYANLDKKGTQ
jgi:hypothetical protein